MEMPIVLTSNNITEGRASAPLEQLMPEYKAGPIRRKPTHPGKVIASYLAGLEITPYAAAPQLGVTKQALGNVIAGKSAVSPNMALRLAQYFRNTTPEFWLSMQAAHDLHVERQKIKGELARIEAAWDPPEEIPVED
jgi:antitoxin HigA-1